LLVKDYIVAAAEAAGFDITCLDVVFEVIVLSTMLYAMTAFSGYRTESYVSSGISPLFVICVLLLVWQPG